MAGSVLILTGPPGAGKSTIADILTRQSESPAAHLHTDDFYDRYIKSGYVLPWLPESQKQNETVTNAVAAAACTYAEGGYFTIIDGIVGPWFLQSYRDAISALCAAILLAPNNADLRTNLGIALERSGKPIEAQQACDEAKKLKVFSATHSAAGAKP